MPPARTGEGPVEALEGVTATTEAARRLEVFLDYLVSRTRDAGHLLVGARFDPLLTPGERRLRDALVRFVEDVNGTDAAAVRGTVAWPLIERVLRELGFEPDGEAE